ncbi:uncharacterized protein LOC106143514 [Amyelois transitella]|uniref:uncharacterized protein LOC106143514 n=1 Tax=Amyelois transitella TaxID=680683 RepID=UPI0029907334|nr:uncharacterized protein LOC106143514 [Amyelois transitella]
MVNFQPLLVILSATLMCVLAEDLKIGNSTNAQLAYVENVKLSAIPLRMRTKNVFYNDENTNPKVIKAIAAIDVDRTAARVTVTAGGVGATFVNVRIRSERGEGLNYQVQIFV